MAKWDKYLDKLEDRMNEEDSPVWLEPFELPTCDPYTQLWGRLKYQYHGFGYDHMLAVEFSRDSSKNYAGSYQRKLERLTALMDAFRQQYVENGPITPDDFEIILKVENFYTPTEAARCKALLEAFDAANPFNWRRENRLLRHETPGDFPRGRYFYYMHEDNLIVLLRDVEDGWWRVHGIDTSAGIYSIRTGATPVGSRRRVLWQQHHPELGSIRSYGVVSHEHENYPTEVRFDAMPAYKVKIDPDELQALPDAYEPTIEETEQ